MELGPRRGSLKVWLIVGLTLTLLLNVYVFSAGPASWLTENNYVDRGWFVPVYRPLGFAIRHNESFSGFMFLYIERCGAVPTFSPVNTDGTPWLPPVNRAD
jgi:hypothetical protein